MENRKLGNDIEEPQNGVSIISEGQRDKWKIKELQIELMRAQIRKLNAEAAGIEADTVAKNIKARMAQQIGGNE